VNEQDLLTMKQVADRLKVCTRTVRNLVKSGKLLAVRIGRSVRVHRDDLDGFIRSLRQPSPVSEVGDV
jgi:excisionase family DNA binding protein